MDQNPSRAGAIGDSPPASIRRVGQVTCRLVAIAPWLWPALRRPVRWFFERVAPDWDRRVDPDSPERLAVVAAGIKPIERAPQRIIDLGTGTGAAALMLARRLPSTEVIGVDISPTMVELATAKVSDELAGRARFEVADIASLPFEAESFELVVQVSTPVFFDEITRVLRPGGHALIISSIGPDTPFHTPDRVLDKGFRKRGLRRVATGAVGRGTFYLTQRPAPVL